MRSLGIHPATGESRIQRVTSKTRRIASTESAGRRSLAPGRPSKTVRAGFVYRVVSCSKSGSCGSTGSAAMRRSSTRSNRRRSPRNDYRKYDFIVDVHPEGAEPFRTEIIDTFTVGGLKPSSGRSGQCDLRPLVGGGHFRFEWRPALRPDGASRGAGVSRRPNPWLGQARRGRTGRARRGPARRRRAARGRPSPYRTRPQFA